MAITSETATAVLGNRILRALPEDERDRLTAHLQLVALPTKTVIFEPGEVIRWVHFPLEAVACECYAVIRAALDKVVEDPTMQ